MGRYILRRLLWMVVVLFFVSLITFLIAYAVPGAPVHAHDRLAARVHAAGQHAALGRRLVAALRAHAARRDPERLEALEEALARRVPSHDPDRERQRRQRLVVRPAAVP